MLSNRDTVPFPIVNSLARSRNDNIDFLQVERLSNIGKECFVGAHVVVVATVEFELILQVKL